MGCLPHVQVRLMVCRSGGWGEYPIAALDLTSLYCCDASRVIPRGTVCCARQTHRL
jgi:hypothetical protein